MRIGLWFETATMSPAQVEAQARTAYAAGYTGFWAGEVGGWDPMTLLTLIGRAVPSARLGTAVLRTYPRHPLALAAQALTIQALTTNRLILGLGTSHAPIIEGQYGLSFEAPARNTREYLSILMPLLRGEGVDYRGLHWSAGGRVGLPPTAPRAEAPTVLVSALGPKMLRLTGELADGTITVWAGPRSIETHFMPALQAAATAAGRPTTPQVVAQVPVGVTGDPERTRNWVNERYGAAGDFSSYRAVLDREGFATPGDAVLAGDEAAVERGVRGFAEAGVTEFVAVPVGPPEDRQRTITLLPQLAPTAS